MNKFSTPTSQTTVNNNSATSDIKESAKQATLAFIRQFARAYMPVANMPGLVLN